MIIVRNVMITEMVRIKKSNITASPLPQKLCHEHLRMLLCDWSRNLVHIQMRDESQSHLQCWPQTPYDCFRAHLQNVADEHVLDVISAGMKRGSVSFGGSNCSVQFNHENKQHLQ